VFNFCDSHLKKNYLIKIVVLLLIFMTVRIPEAQATSAVQVQSISATSGTYSVGQTLNITLTFSANVKIKGRFSLVLETGPTDRTVGCSDTACQNVGVEFTTNTITFPYTVRHGDRASDLNYQSTAALLLTPNWPSNSEKYVKDLSNNIVSLTLPNLDSANSLSGTSNVVINGSGGQAEQFQNAHESVSGLHSLSFIEDLRDNTSWLRGWTGSGSNWGSIKSPYCENVTDANCDTEAVSFRAVLPNCTTGDQLNCIEAVFAKASSGAEVTGVQTQYFPNPSNIRIDGRAGENEDKKGKNFTGSVSRNIPSGTTSSIYTFTGFDHGGGSGQNKYAVTVRVGGWNEPGDTETSRSLFASINPVTFENIPCDERNHGRCWDDVDQSSGLDQDLGKRCIMYQVVDGNTGTYSGYNSQYHINHYLNVDDGNTANDDITTCALKHSFPEDIQFRLKIRLSSEPVGWLHGRLASPDITFNTASGITNVEITGSPVKVPAVSAHSSYENLSTNQKNWYDTNCNSISGKCGSRFSFVSDNWALSTNKNVMLSTLPYSTDSFTNLDLWRNSIGDSASAIVSHWNVRTLSDGEISSAPVCIRTGSGVTGIVTTNSTLYSEGPPSFNASTRSLNYQISSPHYLNDGTTDFLGNYSLFVKPSVANCLFGLTGRSISQSVRVKDQNGNLKSGVVTSISKTDDWFKFTVTNITFSTPSIEALIIEDSDSGSGSGGSSGTPSISALSSIPRLDIGNPLKVKDSFFRSLTPSQIATLSPSDVSRLPIKTISLITSSQAQSLTAEQLKAMKPKQIASLKPNVFASLNSQQIFAFQPDDFKNLKTSQIAKIGTDGARGLIKADLTAFSERQLKALNPEAIKGLDPLVLKSLSISKLKQFSLNQVKALTVEQKANLSKKQKTALRIK
jgi:hypothetical protein